MSQQAAAAAGLPQAAFAKGRMDFDQRPLICIWEITRACQLACRHCRAEAIPCRNPDELTFAEGQRVMDQARELGAPLFVLTGGDPLMRPDFFELIAYGHSIGLKMSASPSGTPLVTAESMVRLAAAGCRRVQFSLDASTAAVHDAFRGVQGSFALTLQGVKYAQEAGMSVQIGTTVTRCNLDDLAAMADLVGRLKAVLWNCFFLVPTGRGEVADMISPAEHEQVLTWLYDLSGAVPFGIKTTEAPHFRRIALERSEAGLPGRRRVSAGVNDAKGFVFISHTGDVCPSGFLPMSAGNVRSESLVEIYRRSPLFTALRDADRLKGKCGVCEYRDICGGSRARALALTGDYLGSDPTCVYQPSGL